MKETFSLLLIPDPSFSAKVSTLKQQVQSFIGRDYPSSHAPAHLSICSFRPEAGAGDALCAFLDTFLLQQNALNLSCQGISSFPKTGTLYLALDTPETFIAFRKKCERALKETFPPLKRNMSLASRPHITLGRSLQSTELEACMEHFQANIQAGTFKGICVRLMLEQMGRMGMYREWNLAEQG
jgi:2'-5' RNA ligase